MHHMIREEKNGGRNIPVRSGLRYLALALDVRKLTDSLIQLVEEGTQSAELNASIKKVVVSLEGAGRKTSIKALRERGTFGHYPSVHAINEVMTNENRDELILKLQGIINPQNAEQQREMALQAIPFFDALERRALYHSNQSHERKTATLSR